MTRQLKALTIWQPHATLLAVGARKVETRSWGCTPGQPLLIHAAAKWDLSIADRCQTAVRLLDRHSFEPQSAAQLEIRNTAFRDTLGMALAVVRVEEIVPMPLVHKTRWNTFDQEFAGFGNGRRGWRLTDVVALPLGIKLIGKQSLWDVPAADVERIAEALGDAADRFWPAPAGVRS